MYLLVCVLWHSAFGNTPLQTDLPAGEWHAASAWESFCSLYRNGMRKPCFSSPLSLSRGHWRWEACSLDQEWTLPWRQSVRKSQPNPAPTMTVWSCMYVQYCNWENILQIAVLADCCPPAPGDAHHGVATLQPDLFLMGTILANVLIKWHWASSKPCLDSPCLQKKYCLPNPLLDQR